MKKYILPYFLFALILIAGLTGCEKDEPIPNGDAPTAEGVVTSLSTEAGNEIYFTGKFMDGLGLASISLVNTDWYLDKTIELSDNPLSYELNYKFKVPADAVIGDHTVKISAINTSQKNIEFSVVVTVNEKASYDAIWTAGSFQWWGWNPDVAYKMIQDPADENWFEILVHAWGGGYDEIKFLGQLAWTPDNWGLVDNANPSLGMINSEASEGIILGADQSSNYPAYYKVRFNPYTLEYTSEEVNPGVAVQSEMYIVGSGFTDYPLLNWNPEEAIPMTPNPYDYGENLFLIEGLVFSNDVSLKFIGQNTGWNPIDIGFDTNYITDEDNATDGYQVSAPVSWTPTLSGGGSADLKFKNQAGSYTILYDHNAKRAIIWKE